MSVVDSLKAILFKHEREALAERERALEARDLALTSEVNSRVASVLSKMDPFEPLLKEFHGVFSIEYERVEDPLNESGKLAMMLWGYQMATDPAFIRMTEWVMNTQANETLKRAAVTPERILYGRAQISTMILFVKEAKRLSEGYKDYLEQHKVQKFDTSAALE